MPVVVDAAWAKSALAASVAPEVQITSKGAHPSRCAAATRASAMPQGATPMTRAACTYSLLFSTIVEPRTVRAYCTQLDRPMANTSTTMASWSCNSRGAVALHEMGHALVALAQPGSDPVHKVSIIPRGIGALGYTLQRPTEDRYLMTRTELQRKLAVLLGGRAAEMLVLGELSTGAADDLAKATDIAREMVTRYGMDAGLGHVAYEPPRSATPELAVLGGQGARTLSEATLQRIDAAVSALVTEGFAGATRLLTQHRALLERGAALLLERETLAEDDLRELAAPLRAQEP